MTYNYKIPCKNCQHKSGIHFNGNCLKVKRCHCKGFKPDNLGYLEMKYDEANNK